METNSQASIQTRSVTQTVSSEYSGPTGTIETTTDCPESEGVKYTPNSPAGQPGVNTFTKHCGINLDQVHEHVYAEIYVPSFNHCIQACSNYNYDTKPNTNQTCVVALFQLSGTPPANCWITGTGVQQVTGVNKTDNSIAFIEG